MKKIVLFFTLIFLIELFALMPETITTSSKVFYAVNEGSYRDLIMFSSLAYEDLPKSCSSNAEGIVSNNCMFKQDDIEGLSNDKVKSMTRIPTTMSEPGQKYYFWLYADISELDGWTIVNYEQKSFEYSSNSLNEKILFTAYTFKKGNDYVIAYRGNKYLDVLEWGQDINKSVMEAYAQTTKADDYALKMYNRITSSCSSCNIYITGHSLGGYLAQSAAAALVQANKYSNLQQLVYFNSPGLSTAYSIDSSSKATITAKEKNLKKLASTSSRVILYTVKGDPVSLLGKHFGEIRQINASTDTIAHHKDYMVSTMVNISTSTENTGAIKLSSWINRIKEIINSLLIDENLNSDAQLAKKNFNTAKMILNLNGNGYETSGFSATGKNTNGSSSLIKNNMNEAMKEYGVNGINDLLNIVHEPDSFLCIAEEGRGTPTINIVASGEDSTVSVGKELNKVLYTKAYNDIKLTAITTGGCAKPSSYQWQRCGSNGACRDLVKADTKDSVYTILKTTAEVTEKSFYRVKVTYGNSYLKGTLNSDGKYEYEEVTDTMYTAYSDIYTIYVDRTPPTCKIVPSSVTIDRGDSDFVRLDCSDNAAINLSLTSTSFSRNRVYASISSVTNKGNYSYIYIKQGQLALGSTKFTLSGSSIKDYAGNQLSGSISFTVYK